MKYYLILILAILVISCKNDDKESIWHEPSDPIHYTYLGCNNVYFAKENKDTIWCILPSNAYLRFKCKDNGKYYTYTAKPDTVFIHDTIIKFKKDTSFIHYRHFVPDRKDSIELDSRFVVPLVYTHPH